MQTSPWHIFKLLLLAVISLLVLLACAQLTAMAIEDPKRAVPVAFFCAFALLTPIGVWLVVWNGARKRRALMLLNYLEQAVRLNLPLPRIVESLAASQRGQPAEDLEVMREMLQRGESLAAALSAVPQMPQRVLRLIAGAERTGRLPQVLARLIEEQRQAGARRLGWPRFSRAYPLVLAIFLIGITTMLTVFVVPKFTQILRDFGTEAPWVLKFTLSVARTIGVEGALLMVLVLLLMLLGQFTFGAGPLRQLFSETFTQRILGAIPGIRELRGQRTMGDMLTYVGDAIEAGRPLDSALAEAAEVSGNSRVREMMARWSQAILRGQPVAAAAREAGLPRLVAGMLATTASVPDSAAVLHFLGRFYAARFSRTLAVLEAATVPACAIVMGTIVGWIALSLFLPIIELIEVASPYPRGF